MKGRRIGRPPHRGRGLKGLTRLGLPPLEEGIPGDPGLFGPKSEVWRLARERVVLLGGQAALLLQIAHPLVAAGVAGHSDFRRDPFARLRATLDATLRITFGDREQAERAAASVAATHAEVRGHLPAQAGPHAAGTPYDASDPNLALWVHATLVWTAFETYRCFVGPLGQARRERYYRESKPFAELFGITEDVMPPTYRDFQAYFRAMVDGPDLVVGEGTRALAREILNPPLPPLARPGARLLTVVTAGLVPARLRGEYRLRWRRGDRALFAAAASFIRPLHRLWPPQLRYWPHYRVALRRVGS